jgi:hypothetical protein
MALAHEDFAYTGVLAQLDARVGPERPLKGLDDARPGGVAAGVDDPIGRMRPFAPECEATAGAVEGDAKRLQDRDALRACGDGRGDDPGIAQASPRSQRVPKMRADVVLGADCGGDAALGVDAVALAQGRLGDQDDRPLGRCSQCDQEPRKSTSHDDHGIAAVVANATICVKLT